MELRKRKVVYNDPEQQEKKKAKLEEKKKKKWVDNNYESTSIVLSDEKPSVEGPVSSLFPSLLSFL